MQLIKWITNPDFWKTVGNYLAKLLPKLPSNKIDKATPKSDVTLQTISLPGHNNLLTKPEILRLFCPIDAKENSNQVNPYTVRISAVIDHSGTALDPNSKNHWGKNAKDQKVKAFNGEIGDGEASSEAPYGYTQKSTPAPFFANKEINYVGAGEDKHPDNYYLNYDGHAGYDFSYGAGTVVIAPADGQLCKARASEDLVYGQGWEVHHTFYIKHQKGISTWFRHCEKLIDEIEAQIGNDYSKFIAVIKGQPIAYVGKFGTPGYHLHFEVRRENKIIDPYEERLWGT